jgi:hypothetical protein
MYSNTLPNSIHSGKKIYLGNYLVSHLQKGGRTQVDNRCTRAPFPRRGKYLQVTNLCQIYQSWECEGLTAGWQAVSGSPLHKRKTNQKKMLFKTLSGEKSLCYRDFSPDRFLPDFVPVVFHTQLHRRMSTYLPGPHPQLPETSGS